MSNRTRPIVESLQYITTIASVLVSLLWLMYAAINRSGHTSIDPFLIVQVQLVPTAMFMLSAVILENPFSSKAFRGLITATVFGLAIPVVLEKSGVLQEYNRWCKNGLSEPIRTKVYAVVIIIGSTMAIAMKHAMKQMKNPTNLDKISEIS